MTVPGVMKNRTKGQNDCEWKNYFITITVTKAVCELVPNNNR